jgi:GTP cyclohydrolase I|tara:strand:- start:346 stop:879 length:534 start_codon:yes stop_codon:yes gene_type:complete
MEDKIKEILFKIGDDPRREGLLETPTRVVKSWKELYSGYDQDPSDVFKTFENEGFDNMVICKDIEFYSMCEHHMLPFFGKAHVAYIPNNKIIGLSKLARLTNVFSRRLQNQERLTDQIAKTLVEKLDAKGAGVVMEGKHFCMMSRGVQKQNSSMITSSLYGVFREQSVRQEFLTLIG